VLVNNDVNLGIDIHNMRQGEDIRYETLFRDETTGARIRGSMRKDGAVGKGVPASLTPWAPGLRSTGPDPQGSTLCRDYFSFVRYPIPYYNEALPADLTLT
jgi:hypothetical protein